jgi:uncharacterized membrane protein
MFWANVFLTGQDWLWPAAGISAVAFLILVFSYRNAMSDRWVSLVCLGLKLLAILALATCLLNPLWNDQRPKPGANIFLILADNSQGLQIKDRNKTESRGSELKSLLQPAPTGWQESLDEQFQVRRFLFDSRLQSVRDFGQLDFEGRYSSIGYALKTVARRFEGRPTAGVFLFTDGNATDLPDGLIEGTGLPPVYPVIIGGGEVTRDIAIGTVNSSQTAFEDAPVTLQAEVEVNGYAGQEIVAELFDLNNETPPPATDIETTNAPVRLPTGQPFETQTLQASKDQDVIQFRFQFRPRTTGVGFYQLRVAARDELIHFETPLDSPEATLANNQRTVVVDRGRGPYRILYVTGRPNWEYKFLNRALASDDQIQLVGLIRVARREPKFVFKGRQGETSNPLFRGFDKKTEETEEYDQPVLIRLNTRDALELKGGFPIAEEELYQYHAVILDDLEASFFTQDQQSLLLRYVSERGGGFLMLGGPDGFRSGNYRGTPLANLLPVYLDVPELDIAPENLRMSLTREGWLQPWVRLRTNEADERFRFEDMPGFTSLNRVDHIKPGATPVAMVIDERNRSYPALVSHRYGRGRSAALLVGDYWRWGFKDESSQRDLAKAWRQMVRWLVADVPSRTSLLLQPLVDDPNQSLQIQTRLLDESFQPIDNATVEITVEPVDPALAINRSPETPLPATAGAQQTIEPNTLPALEQPASLRLTAEASSRQAGLFETTYVPRKTGGYRIHAKATDSQGVLLGQTEAGWTANAAAAEFQSLKPNLALLETIAARTGGKVIAADALEDFVRELPSKEAPIQETWSRPLWDHPAVFLFALSCLVIEWGLRRRKGLA